MSRVYSYPCRKFCDPVRVFWSTSRRRQQNQLVSSDKKVTINCYWIQDLIFSLSIIRRSTFKVQWKNWKKSSLNSWCGLWWSRLQLNYVLMRSIDGEYYWQRNKDRNNNILHSELLKIPFLQLQLWHCQFFIGNNLDGEKISTLNWT